MKKLLFLLLILCVIATFLFFKVQSILYAKNNVYSEVFLQIHKGDSLKKTAKNLYDNGLISNEFAFLIYARLNKIYPQIKAGEYLFDKSMNMVELANFLVKGKTYLRKVTIPEGLNVFEIKQILDNNEFLSGNTPDFADGDILPETYTFSRGDSRKSIIEQAIKEQNSVLDAAWNEKDVDLPLKNKEELLILASIVEKETGIAQERNRVASVFINRLKIGMRLQTDPTVIYALTNGKYELNRPLSRKDLEIDSPYNTYKIEGLPPSPICSPGKEAIFAVAHPDNTPFLYFVASGTGGHNFAKSLAEHNDNVKKWHEIQKN